MPQAHESAIKSWVRDLPLSPLNTTSVERAKVAIIGASMLGDDPPPLDDHSWDVWGCNSLWRKCLDSQGRLRADAWFEMHPIEAQTQQELRDMIDCPIPLYVLTNDVLENHWVEYPLDEIRKKFGERDYYTCTFAYQIALALLRGYREIGLWGVELWQGSTREMRIEFPCLMYWLGLARGAGVKITLPSYSNLMWHEHLYGYDYDEDVKQSAIDDRWIAVNWCQEEAKRRKVKDGERFSMRSMLTDNVSEAMRKTGYGGTVA